MSDDNFGKTSGKLIENIAIGAAGIAGDALAGPGFAVVAGAVVMTALDWLNAGINASDKRLFEARFAAIEDQFARLDQEVRKVKADLADQGKMADRQDFLSQENVYSDFARAVSEAASPEKRIALVNAAAHQFDPRMGSAAARAHWFAQVRQLNDIEIRLVQLIAKQWWLAFDGSCFHVNMDHKTAHPIAGIDVDEAVALETTALDAPARSVFGRLVGSQSEVLTQSTTDKKWQTTVFALTPAGRCVAKLIAD